MMADICDDVRVASGSGLISARTGAPGTRRMLLGSVALAMFAVPTLAHAQAQPQAQTPPAANAADSAAQLGDIVVTATREVSTVNKVPLSLQAFTRDALDARGVREVDDVFRLTPGVTYTQGISAESSISIRGIASTSGAATTGIYIDDTPIQTRSIGFTTTPIYPAIFDIDRVEVLRGPQGTLFGAGSMGGTVRFITPAPSLTDASVYGRAEIASTKSGDASYEAGVAVNVPINDKLAVRFMGWDRRDGGYINHISRTTGVLEDHDSDWMNTYAARIAVLYQPTSDLKITPSFYYQHQYQNDQQAYVDYVSNPSTDTFNNNVNAPAPATSNWKLPALNITYSGSKISVTGNISYFDQNNVIDHDYGDFLATLLGATVTPQSGIPGDPGYYNQTFYVHHQHSWTGELRVSSNASSWINWTLGAFYQHETQYEGEFLPETSYASFNNFVQALTGVSAAVAFGGVPLVNGVYSYVSNLNSTDEQEAMFGQATITPLDHVKVILGGRYSHNSFVYDTAGMGPYAGASVVTASGSQSQWSFTPKLGAEYEFNSANRLYLTASKGFRPGGANSQVAARCGADLANLGLTSAPSSYNSDDVWSYELGTKNRFFGNKLSINASVYRVDWQGIQESISLPTCGGSFVSNLGRARSQGFDLEVETRPIQPLMLQFAAGYDKATYRESILAAPDANGDRAILVNAGDSLGNPPWQFTAAAQYDFKVVNQNAYARADYQFTARETLLTPARDPVVSGYSTQYLPIPEQHYVTARIGVKTSNNLDISAFVNNLLNQHPEFGHLQFGATANLISVSRTLRPRTVGLTLTVHE